MLRQDERCMILSSSGRDFNADIQKVHSIFIAIDADDFTRVKLNSGVKINILYFIY